MAEAVDVLSASSGPSPERCSVAGRECTSTPITFDGCFGWLHHGSSDRGVVLCAPIGHEAVATHRGWRHLAQSLAMCGLHVVRFDYHGTDDSEGDADGPDRIAVWQRNVSGAAATLRDRCGVTTVSLVGLRLGAALGWRAAMTIPHIDNVALLAPVVSGRAHVRELRLLARVWHEQAFGRAPVPDSDGAFEVTGMRHSAATVAALAALDLRQVDTPARRVLVMDNGDRQEITDFVAGLRARGRDVARLPFPGEAEFLAEPVTARVPHEAFSRLTLWLGERAPRGSAAIPAWAITRPIRFADGHDEPIRFGPDQRLFGVLCHPAQRVVGRPVAIMVNTGRTPHTGDGRFFVTLARRLAGLGVPSLRMDITGLGDSEADPRFGEPALHDAAASRDVSAAIDVLAARGFDAFAVIGICSGAFVAFQSALADRRIASVDLINQQKFVADDRPPANARSALRRPAGFYVRSLLRPYAWRAVLAGRVDVPGVVCGVLRPLIERELHRLGQCREWLTGRPTKAGAVHRLFGQLEEQGVAIRLWYGDSDPGWPELESWFGRRGDGARKFRHVELNSLGESDHAMHGSEARARLTERLCHALGPEGGEAARQRRMVTTEETSRAPDAHGDPAPHP